MAKRKKNVGGIEHLCFESTELLFAVARVAKIKLLTHSFKVFITKFVPCYIIQNRVYICIEYKWGKPPNQR